MKSRKYYLPKLAYTELLLYTPHKYTIRGNKTYKWWEYIILDTDKMKEMKYTITRELREYYKTNGVYYL